MVLALSNADVMLVLGIMLMFFSRNIAFDEQI